VPSPALPLSYVTIEGPIGVGKTSLVELLTERFEGVKLLEDVNNPFLADFYKDRPGTAFQTQLYFLLSRFKQQQDLLQKGLFDRLVVADYAFQKDRVFAYLNLTDEELALYEKVYAPLEQQAPTPDLMVLLLADVDTCLARIHKRKRTFENKLSREYLSQLIDAYHHFYHYYTRSPLLVVDTRHVNFPERAEDLEDLLQLLRKPVRGTQYYVPLGSR
jgi:deoxyadenosine/deoxycytidine kinase